MLTVAHGGVELCLPHRLGMPDPAMIKGTSPWCLSDKRRSKPQPHVVGRPRSVAAAQSRRKEPDGARQDYLLVRQGQVSHKRVRKCGEPARHAGRQWCRAGEQHRQVDPEAVTLKPLAPLVRY